MATTIIITIKLKYFLAKRERCQERETGSVNGPVSKTSALSCDNFLVEFRSNT